MRGVLTWAMIAAMAAALIVMAILHDPPHRPHTPSNPGPREWPFN